MQLGRVDLVVDLAGVDLRPGQHAKKNRPGVRGGEVVQGGGGVIRSWRPASAAALASARASAPVVTDH